MTDFEKELSAAKALVEKRLAEFFPGDGLQAACGIVFWPGASGYGRFWL